MFTVGGNIFSANSDGVKCEGCDCLYLLPNISHFFIYLNWTFSRVFNNWELKSVQSCSIFNNIIIIK